MCYVCLKDNPFDVAEAFGKRYGVKGLTQLQAKAIYVKQLLRVMDQHDETRCDIGEGTYLRLKEEQAKFARQM